MSKKNKVKITKERKKAKKIISTILDCAVLGINLETNKINYCDYVFAYALEYFMNWGQLLYQVDEKKISKIEKCYNFVTQCRNNESGKIMLEGKDATVIVEALEILGQKFLLDDLEFEEAKKSEKSIVLTPRIMIDDLKESFLDKMEMYCQIENYVTKNYPEWTEAVKNKGADKHTVLLKVAGATKKPDDMKREKNYGTLKTS